MKSILLIIIFYAIASYSQNLSIDKIEPSNWWAEHSYNKIQLMIYGSNLDSANVSFNCNDIIIEKVHSTENSDYLFVDILISPKVKPGDYKIEIGNKYGKSDYTYSIFERENSKSHHNGFSNHDIVYLIFPDRFSNGSSENDLIFNENEEYEFGSLNGRHGGDIKGIIDKLDYLVNLGVTALWITPLLENNMYMSYHGYAATDLYNVDPRFGDNKLYKELVNEAHKRGLKIIYDHVANHIGINHRWIKSLPTKTWLNGRPGDHLPADHNKTAYVDIYAAEQSRKNPALGWFTDYMPDLNQSDTLLGNYIIQNTIWWIEFSGIDGIREDTYPYANQIFMAKWAEEIFKHYPNFNIVGEVWKGEPAILAAFQTNSYFPKEFNSNLPVITDFAFRDAVIDYLFGNKSLDVIYETIAKDFVYSNPNNLLVFFDNHDVDRGMYAAKGDMHKFKVALTLTLTSRGIPQLFYGTEIGLDGGGHHGRIRAPFPGGFEKDSLDAFTIDGRNDTQNEIYNFTKKLIDLRKEYKSLSIGKLTQYKPKDNIYIYFKTLEDERVVVIINDNNNSINLKLDNYLEMNQNSQSILDIINDKEIILDSSNVLSLESRSVNILKIAN